MDIKIFSTEYVDGNILYYDFDGVLFSIEITEDMCRREFLETGTFIEDHERGGEHIEREVYGETWPVPGELDKDQLKALAIKHHDVSLKCTEDEIITLIDTFGQKFKPFRNQ